MTDWFDWEKELEERRRQHDQLIAKNCLRLAKIPEKWEKTVCTFESPLHPGYEFKVFLRKREIESPQEEWYLVASAEDNRYYYSSSINIDHFPVPEMQQYLRTEAAWMEVKMNFGSLIDHISRRGDG